MNSLEAEKIVTEIITIHSLFMGLNLNFVIMFLYHIHTIIMTEIADYWIIEHFHESSAGFNS